MAKNVCLIGVRTVRYRGEMVTIPSNMKFIGTDDNDALYAYAIEPTEGPTHWRSAGMGSVFLGTISLDGMPWRDSLREV